MSGPVAILAPLDHGDAIELGKRIFRKQVLRAGSINYKGRRLDFTPDYLDGLVQAFRDEAFDTVPLVFAPADNAHTQDVDRIRGNVIGLERVGDRLDALVEFTDDRSAQLVRDHPKLGVSVRIEQPIERADGKTFPAAVQHVLATANPRITGMAPWTPVDLATHTGEVLDLSTLDFADLGEDTTAAATTETQEDDVADEPVFTPEEIARLRALLDITDHTADDTDGTDDGDGYEMPSDEELAAIAAAALDDDTEQTDTEREPSMALARETVEALELAQSRLDAQEIELARMRAERDTARFERERDQLAETYGIPPRITELARPLLTGSHAIELASGARVDAAEVMRKVLTAVGEHVKLIDLSGPTVFEASRDEDEQRAAADRETAAAEYAREFGLL